MCKVSGYWFLVKAVEVVVVSCIGRVFWKECLKQGLKYQNWHQYQYRLIVCGIGSAI